MKKAFISKSLGVFKKLFITGFGITVGLSALFIGGLTFFIFQHRSEITEFKKQLKKTKFKDAIKIKLIEDNKFALNFATLLYVLAAIMFVSMLMGYYQIFSGKEILDESLTGKKIIEVVAFLLVSFIFCAYSKYKTFPDLKEKVSSLNFLSSSKKDIAELEKTWKKLRNKEIKEQIIGIVYEELDHQSK